MLPCRGRGLVRVYTWGAIAAGLGVVLLPLAGFADRHLAAATLCALVMAMFISQRTFVLARGWAGALFLRECVQCGYSLRRLPDGHACPECGYRYDVDELRLGLARYLGLRRHLMAQRAADTE